MTANHRIVIIGFSLSTALLIAICCAAICASLVLLHPGNRPDIDVPQLPQGSSTATREANELKYGPVNLEAAREVKQGLFDRLRARRCAQYAPRPVQCESVTYATTPVVTIQRPSSLLPQPTTTIPYSAPAPATPSCPDGSCDAGSLSIAPSVNAPTSTGSLDSSIGQLEAIPANDADKMQLLIVGRRDLAPATWFATDPTLARVRASVAYTHIEPGSTMHRERYGYLGTNAPIVSLAWGDGRSIYFVDGANVPGSPTELFAEMKAAVQAARSAVKQTDSGFDHLFNLGLNVPPTADPTDCPDGNCYPTPRPDNDRLFPRLRPNPDSGNPLLDAAEGFFKDTLTSGIWLVFAAVALGVMIVFAVLIFGAIILVIRTLG